MNTSADPTQRDQTVSRRRRLWQLPTQAHELLLAMSFTPDWLRRETARTLGQIHKGRCVLKGRDVDVLYSVVHDVVTRNPLSEALHKQLETRNASAVRAMAAVKDELALQASWARARDDDSSPATVPAALWAVLTHPLGENVQSAGLYDARAWVFTHARRSVGRVMTQQQADARAQQASQRADELQARLAAQQQHAAEALRQAQAKIARLQGQLARQLVTTQEIKVSEAAVHRGKPCEAFVRVGVHKQNAPDPLPVVATAPGPAATAAATSAINANMAAAAAPARASCPAPARPPPVAVDASGQRVLCVGGIQHAVARYRGRIEKLGGRFEHHDGGIEDGIPALDARLGRADVVICQAACINHEAYHRVKRHCERTGTPCVYLDRPSLSRLDRALAVEPGAPHASH